MTNAINPQNNFQNTDSRFARFAKVGNGRHIFIEDNSVMTQSYLMVAPNGCLFQNGGAEYRYSRPLMDIPFEAALKEIDFAEEKFFNKKCRFKKIG